MKTHYIFLILCLLLPGMVLSQDKNNEDSVKEDTVSVKKKKKTGWKLGGILPAVSFDTDLGFQYGLLANIYDYGDGSRYPDYDQSLYMEVSRMTKGSGINRIFYDTWKLIKGVQVTADLSYLTEKSLDFYGFNGYEARYISSWEDDEDPAYKTRVFYRHERKMFRFKADFQGDMIGKNFRWLAGLALYHFKTSTVDIERLNKGKSESKQLPDTATLYDQYMDWEIIGNDVKDGGLVTYLKAGLVYDTRDNRPNPMRGMWSELVLRMAPSFMGMKNYGHIKLSLVHRQYFTLVKNDLSFVYRLAYQGTIAGKAPWFIQPVLATSYLTSATSQGLGGANTIRGVKRNRVVGDGIVYGTVEFRWKFIRTHLFKQDFYIAAIMFTDAGQVVTPISIDKSHIPSEINQADYFDQSNDSMHLGSGGGLYFVLNHNFVVAFDYGKAWKAADGNSGLYINLNFLF